MSPDEGYERNGLNWRVRELEEWRREVNRDGTPGLRITRERIEGLNERNKDEHLAIRERLTAIERAQAWFLRSAIFVSVSFIISVLLWLVTKGGTQTP